jgi:hypothetical protein
MYCAVVLSFQIKTIGDREIESFSFFSIRIGAFLTIIYNTHTNYNDND